MGDDEGRIEADGSASLHITEGGKTVEVNSPLGLSIEEGARWQGRPEHEPVLSDEIEVKRFLRKGLYTMKPPPVPRAIRPVPKPASKQVNAAVVSVATRCPLCNGEGWFGDHSSGGAAPCELCDGVGLVTRNRAERWLEDHG